MARVLYVSTYRRRISLFFTWWERLGSITERDDALFPSLEINHVLDGRARAIPKEATSRTIHWKICPRSKSHRDRQCDGRQ